LAEQRHDLISLVCKLVFSGLFALQRFCNISFRTKFAESLFEKHSDDITSKMKDNMEALGNKMKKGTQEADKKTGISHGLDQMGNKMKQGTQEADKKTGVSHGLDQMGNKMKEGAHEADKKTGASHGLDQMGNKAQEFDKQHNVTDNASKPFQGIVDAAENVKGAFQEHVIDPVQKHFQGGSDKPN
jgi:hypothetical protein